MKQLVGLTSRYKARAFAVCAVLLIGLFSILSSTSVLAAAELYYPTPASGTYALGSQFVISIRYSNNDEIDNGSYSITFQPSGNLQYLGGSAGSNDVESYQATVNPNGSVRLNFRLDPSNDEIGTITVANINFKATGGGAASLVLSAGRSDDSNQVPTQNGSYSISVPPAPPPPAPKPPTPAPAPAPPANPTAPNPPGSTEQPEPEDETPSNPDDSEEPEFIGPTTDSDKQAPSKKAAGSSGRPAWLTLLMVGGGLVALWLAFAAFRRRQRDRPLSRPVLPPAPASLAPRSHAPRRVPGILALVGIEPPTKLTKAPPLIPLPPPPHASAKAKPAKPAPKPAAKPAKAAAAVRPVSPAPESDEPLDMFEMAKLHPESFGRVPNAKLPKPPKAVPPPAAPPKSE